VEIGDFVKITKGVTILTHGYDWSVLRKEYGEILASAGKVTIGSNVFIGMNTTILKNTVIGNNVIIGANSLVSKDIPNNVVAAGNPAKIIMTLDEYLIKRKKKYILEAKTTVRSFYETYGVLPDMNHVIDFFPLYTRRDIEEINKCPDIKNILTDEGGIDEKLLINLFLATNPKFESYQQFLDWCLSD
jgi:UDP-3-O-[3-hydroxymyristoyl] glucosamine N-acyltransferase